MEVNRYSNSWSNYNSPIGNRQVKLQNLNNELSVKREQLDEIDNSEQEAISKLKQREQEVISHEMSHSSVGGSFAGSASYTYTQGPDGKTYISGGEVSISIQTGNTPEETISNMQQVKAAAMAPSSPSSADHGVAATASQIEVQARQELSKPNDNEEEKGNFFSAYA